MRETDVLSSLICRHFHYCTTHSQRNRYIHKNLHKYGGETTVKDSEVYIQYNFEG